MSNITEQAIHVGVESTYGTAVTTTRSFEGQSDSFKLEPEFLDSAGFRSSMAAALSTRRVQINKGGTGSLEVDVLTGGMGLLLQTFGGTTAPAQVAATDQYETVVVADDTGSVVSLTVQMVRVDSGGTKRIFTHAGAMVTGWTISGEVGGLAKIAADLDWQTVVENVAEGTPTYPTATTVFPWDRCAVEIDGSPIAATSFDIAAALGLKTDRHYLNGTSNKSVPVRSELPEYTGSISAHFEDLTLYNLYKAGTECAINVKWSGVADSIESGYTEELEIDIPVASLEGDSPEASMGDMTGQPLSFKAMDNLTDAPVTVTYRSEDTSL